MSVFHLKYRPTKFSDLDLTDVAESLKKYLVAKEAPQSFLFSGPKGAGKTSAARILARAINCSDPKDGEPCGKCDSCKEILKSSSLDVIEIDAASNRGIDDIRSLKERAYLLPTKLKKKVFIIDEVHMLTKDAFNALLKLIEEPPKHTVFVLCTTDAEKIPETVLSRLVRVDFRKGEKKELVNSLKKIIEGEGIEIVDEVIDFIVGKSDGSFRNLQRSFNELYLQLGKKLDIDKVVGFYQDKNGNYKELDFDNDLNEGKLKLILERLEKMAEIGVDFSGFRLILMNYFQKKILSFCGLGERVDGGINLEESEFFISLLVKASKLEKEIEIDQLPLELAVIEFVSQKRSNIEITQKEENKVEVIKKKEEEISKVEKKIEQVISDMVTLEIERVEEKWGNLLSTIKPFNHSVEAFLRASRPKSIRGNILLVEVFYPFHKDRLEEVKNRKIVEDCISRVFGVDLCFECTLAKDKKEPLIIKNDTPMESVSEQLVENNTGKSDIYDVAKEIFG